MARISSVHRPVSTVVREVLHTAIDGGHQWGVYESTTPLSMRRSGWGRFLLTVYPPGTNLAERRAITFCRRWPAWGGMILLVAAMIAASVRPSVTTMVPFVLLYATGMLIGFAKTRRLRSRTRMLTVVVAGMRGRTDVIGNAELLNTSVASLVDLDLQLQLGILTPVEYEAGWSRVYDAIGDKES
ncbi:MAG: hypothetical protein QOG18_121 [Microbacteriaceae bacterium]|jgi:hypothetical protein|nr:hypothetical protein [Microbacteriaceae bacterium]